MNMNFLPIELCKKLQGIMNLKSFFVYNKEQIINPEIVEKHGDLTDDGYYELTKDCGGPYKFNEVYIYDYKLMLRRDVWVEKEMVYAYTLEQVFTWLRDDKNVHIGIIPYFTTSTKNNIKWIWEILLGGKIIECKNTLYVDKDYNFTKLASEDYCVSYDDACIDVIEYVINNLI